ncbi:MAG: TIGR04013 family B12-binding domain/radical SAM domain-containing protein [Atribacterota bacterium]
MNREKPTVLVFYSRKNRFSFNALIASLCATDLKRKVNLVWAINQEELYHRVAALPQPVLLLFSSTSPEKEEKRKILHTVKNIRPETILCGGGPHLSACPEAFLPLATITVQGEGEVAIQEIVSRFITGQLSLEYQTVFTGPVDLDRFPPFPHELGVFGPIEITRGCPFACAFCQTSFLFGPTVRHRNLSHVLEYVKIMKRKNLLDLRFITPNALAYGSPDGRTVCPNALAQLLGELRKIVGKKGRIFFGSFPSEIRPDFASWELLKLLKEHVDNDNLIIGAQSGSNALLRRMHRQHQQEDILRATELALRAGFKVNVDFIFGCPEENEEEERENLATVCTLAEMGAIIHAHTFMPLPGTPWGEKAGTPLSPQTKKVLGRLAQQGKLFGQWYTQERHAQILRKNQCEEKRK